VTALSLAAAEFGMIGSADAQAGKANLPHVFEGTAT
jgi:hypothetical protein